MAPRSSLRHLDRRLDTRLGEWAVGWPAGWGVMAPDMVRGTRTCGGEISLDDPCPLCIHTSVVGFSGQAGTLEIKFRSTLQYGGSAVRAHRPLQPPYFAPIPSMFANHAIHLLAGSYLCLHCGVVSFYRLACLSIEVSHHLLRDHLFSHPISQMRLVSKIAWKSLDVRWITWISHPLYIHTYIHLCIHTYIHSYIHTYRHTYMHTYIHTYMHTYMHKYIHKSRTKKT
ncbi:unnamed protein product [Protopolystoma xenopodis]|uniref:Uncharacterized protein n=1 Tax=Protopolystoma xenopodis TaxID=117903 RepID=A0A3S5FGG4_9PLAT|nr:unnamed protein product [Protopolystoma xenopodis]